MRIPILKALCVVILAACAAHAQGPAAAGRAFRIRLRASALARGVHLSAAPLEGNFSDNFFDLLPGREVTVEFRPRRAASLAALRRALKVRSLADAFARG